MDADYHFRHAAKCCLELRLGAETYHINSVCDLTWDYSTDYLIEHGDWTDNYLHRSRPGVYAMLDELEDSVLYIGSTDNLARRHSNRFNAKDSGEFSSWRSLPSHLRNINVESIWTARQLEKYLVRFLDPKYNKYLRRSEEETRRELERIRGTEDVMWINGKPCSWDGRDR
jgi:hypothetical protein